MIKRDHIVDSFKAIQDHICENLEKLDGTAKFKEDPWMRPGGGGGRTRIIQGEHIEKGGVNFSAVFGPMPERITRALDIDPTSFFATGVSIVLHPRNPHVPIVHMNVRYFETDSGLWWFGGGIDMTPHYVNVDDAQAFHRTLKGVCDRHHKDYYPEFKKWADDYFYIKHRKETRGIGGIFFDRLNKDAGEKSSLFEFVKDVGYAFI
ncbi:MAG: coproporphyrinogen III oxidase, partial [Saprospiraceae bacterium]|nr:coproporphyrinogen III oxidase [Saprospiraceae bacterium]